jgi:hypothetical protein
MMFNEQIAARFEVFTAMLMKIQLCLDYPNPEDGGSKHLQNVFN